MRLAVVGAGWGGLAAAVAATQRGHAVTVFEAARLPGGRARTLPVGDLLLDNGQHILIGAYVETLTLMEQVGVRLDDVLLRLPLVLRHPDGSGLALPLWQAPLDAAAGILTARGWSWADKWSLLRASLAWQRARFQCPPQASVADLCTKLTQRVRDDLIEPLCVSALNTPAAQSSGAVFLRVLRDSLFGRGHGRWGASNLLLPRQDLGRLFPQAAIAWLQAKGAEVRLGQRVQAVAATDARCAVDGERFDAVVLACPAPEAARLARGAAPAGSAWAAQAEALGHEAIATVYVTGGPRLPCPMLALSSGPDAPAQFVFDRSQLGGPAGLLAFVVSASQGDKETLEAKVLAQARSLGWHVQPLQTVVEKRATFACVPGLVRPPQAVAPRLWACGDYVDGPYPATIEGAVRSGIAVAGLL
ncbi:hydroxysqualene dehydroxylase HpnE [Ramlibacter sp. XY19]|uniref:hydroxysqualene dehydroxylase HpnE n=1 Tax=Ramlibacter paludis TaxID=2908000 RepID=UPI0023DBEE45|nr:hydroxysqualene dehydroxylase HpnE [Ramlibacter paludis]MCG2592816.1 hydroxysqualene dehydroxylase HpnE [Ramlibacter paludis]